MEPPEKCPEFIVALIDACWQEDPDERPTFDQIFNDLDQMAPGKSCFITIIHWK